MDLHMSVEPSKVEVHFDHNRYFLSNCKSLHIYVSKQNSRWISKDCLPNRLSTTAGLLVHAVVFTLILRLIMDLKI